MVAQSDPKADQEALDKLSDLRSRIKAARLEKLIARQMEQEVQLVPLEPKADVLDEPSKAQTLQEPSAEFQNTEVQKTSSETLNVSISQQPSDTTNRTQSAALDGNATVAAAMERLVRRDELIKQLTSKLQQKENTISDLELALAKAESKTDEQKPEPTGQTVSIEKVALLRKVHIQQLDGLKQENASLELKLVQFQNRLEIAAEEKQIAEARQDSLATRAHALESELRELQKAQLSYVEEQERKDRAIAALQSKVAELSEAKLTLEKHLITTRKIAQSASTEQAAAANG